ncbi:MAG: threonine synthase [Magnetococcales bacterium]|nr:threonine synthase [Magnetococcales bacterium]
MRYISTRGGVAPVTFSQAVMMGLATDGGLLLPERIPRVGADELRRWGGLPFAELAVEVMRPFVVEEPLVSMLPGLVQRAYGGFSHPEITPVRMVGGRPILELFHGPTLAFKDVALQFLGNLFEYLLDREAGELNILGATSGDTGSAAIHGVRGRSRIRIAILHPHGRVSPMQERQMTTVLDANVTNIAVEGTFDDGQRIVKSLFNDLEFKERYRLGAVNSINWARILAQIVYYFYAWGRLSGGRVDRPVAFAVPTGNFGDVFAGFVARKMGLPISRLIMATNRNDILTRFVDTGHYAMGEVHPTVSPSMDIQVSSNFERYLYYLLGEDPAAVRGLMDRFSAEGSFSVTPEQARAVSREFVARAVGEEGTLAEIRELYQATGYLADPHTAVGLRAASGEGEVICLATAHPAKFGAAVREATGVEPELPPVLAGLRSLPTRCTVLPAEVEAVRRHLIHSFQ